MANAGTGFAGVRANWKVLRELLVEMKPSRDCTKQEHLVSSVKPSLYGHEAMCREPKGRNNFLVITKHQNHTHTLKCELYLLLCMQFEE